MLVGSAHGDTRLTERCATEGCGGQVTVRIEDRGVGAYYCSGCALKIEQLLVDKNNGQ